MYNHKKKGKRVMEEITLGVSLITLLLMVVLAVYRRSTLLGISKADFEPEPQPEYDVIVLIKRKNWYEPDDPDGVHHFTLPTQESEVKRIIEKYGSDNVLVAVEIKSDITIHH